MSQRGDLPLRVCLHSAKEKRHRHKTVELKTAETQNGGGRAHQPAADDLDGVVTPTLLVLAFPAHRKTALAQRRSAETQVIVMKKLGFLDKNDKAGHQAG